MITVWLRRAAFAVPVLLCAGEDGSVLDSVIASGRCTAMAEAPDARVNGSPQIAPGLPPMLTFRSMEGARHGRFSDSGLMMDDAGH